MELWLIPSAQLVYLDDLVYEIYATEVVFCVEVPEKRCLVLIHLPALYQVRHRRLEIRDLPVVEFLPIKAVFAALFPVFRTNLPSKEGKVSF